MLLEIIKYFNENYFKQLMISFQLISKNMKCSFILYKIHVQGIHPLVTDLREESKKRFFRELFRTSIIVDVA